MDTIIKKVLRTIEDNGFEAYIVGGYVRDKILGIKTTDVDIATNALLKDLNKMFSIGKCSDMGYGSYRIHTEKYNFDITTYREEYKYLDRRPTEIKYVNNLLVDINRRDFTINSLCMNKNGEIIDLLNGKEDILNKKIKVIGDIETKFKEDPLRMLRAIRFAITLGFSIEEDALKYIVNHKEDIKALSYQRKRNELELIFISDNLVKGLEYLKHLDLLSVLEIDYDNFVKVDDILGIWAQLKASPKYAFTKVEMNNINKIREIVKYGKIDRNILFKYDLYIALVAGSILKVSKKEINRIYKNMPIYEYKDITITTKEIIDILNIEPSKIIKDIMEDLKNQILNHNLANNKHVVIKYLESRYRNE